MATPMEGLISPPASAASPAPSHGSNIPGQSSLPTPRQHALRAGSEKEIALINYLDGKMLRISRRYGKKFTEPENGSTRDDAPGYTNMDQLVADLDPLVDVAWVSGTPHLQISYLLSLVGTLLSYLPAFSFSSSIFALLNKVDLAFVSLLRLGPQASPDSAHSQLSTTDKVRVKSLIEETRVTAVKCASASGYTASVQDLSLSDDTDSDDDDDEQMTEQEASQQNDSIGIALSRIYKRTLEILGDTLT